MCYAHARSLFRLRIERFYFAETPAYIYHGWRDAAVALPDWKRQCSSPTIANGVVYVGTGDGYVYALKASDGTRLWRYLTGGAVSTPTVVNGVVYIGSADGYVYALKASDGTLQWSYLTGSYPASPTVVNGVVYVGDLVDYYLYALKASDGTLQWRYQTGGNVDSSPAVVNGVVYFSASPDAGVGYVFAVTA
jgi:outer membrane protein assembly factor BamB